MLLVKVTLVLTECELVSSLKSTKVISFLLHSIICQMNKFILKLRSNKRTRACPQVAIIIDKSLQFVIDQSAHGKASNVKFSLVVQGWFLYVLLYYKGAILVVFTLLDYVFNVFEF